jgi:hypothetical protein
VTTADTAPAARPPFWRRIRVRSVLSFICLAISILCLIVGSLFVWVRVSAHNPDGFVAAALNVQGQVDVQTAIVNYVENDVITQARAEEAAAKVIEPLPITQQRKEFLASVLASSLRSRIGDIVQTALSTGAAKQLIENVAQRASEGVVNLINNQPGAFEFQGDAIVFNTEPLVKEARAAVDARLGALAKYIPAPLAQEGYPVYTVASGSGVSALRSAITIINLMSWLLPLLFALLLILGIVLARERRSAAYRAMIAIAVSAIVLIIALRIAKNTIAGLLSSPASEQVYNAIINEIGTRLLAQTLWLTFLAAIVAFVLWVFGPDKLAKRLRAWAARRWHDLQAGVPADEEGKVTTFIRQYPRHLEIAMLAVVVIVLIALPSVTATAWIVALVVIVVWFLFVEYTRTARWMVSLAARMRRKDEASA